MEGKKKSIQRIFNLCLEIQTRGEGVDGFPFVSFSSANYGNLADVYIMENGFKKDGTYDASYNLDEPISRINCEFQLKEILKALKGGDLDCTQE